MQPPKHDIDLTKKTDDQPPAMDEKSMLKTKEFISKTLFGGLDADIDTSEVGKEEGKTEDLEATATTSTTTAAPEATKKPRKRVDIKEAIEASADAAAKKAVEAMTDAAKPEEEAKTEVQTEAPVEIAPEYQDDYEAFKELEATDKKFSGYSKRFSDFVKKEQEYIANWKKENRGREFDSESTDHDDFYSEHEPQVDDKELNKAKIRVEAKKIVKESSSKQDEQIKAQTIKSERERIGPVIMKARGDAMAEAIGVIVDKEVAEKAKTSAGFNEIKESDPFSAKVAESVMVKYAPLVDAVVEVFESEIGFVGTAPHHRALADVANSIEASINKMPAKDKLDEDGREFVVREKFLKMDAKDRADHWTVGPEVIKFAVISMAKQEIKAAHDDRKADVELLSKRKGGETKKADDTKKADETTSKPAPAAKPAPASSVARVDTTANTGKVTGKTQSEKIGMAMFGVNFK